MGKPLSRDLMDRSAGWRYSNGVLHAAFDYRVPIRTPIFAVRKGRITRVELSQPNLDVDVDGKSGDRPNFIQQRVTYKGVDATVTYAHVSPPPPEPPVQAGDTVVEGQLIGFSGHNGHSEGPHLHISVVTGRTTSTFPELSGLAATALQPTDGLAANGRTVYPPSLVYGPMKFNELDAGDIVFRELRFRTVGSVTVKRLQHRLNGIHLEGGADLFIDGNYRRKTRDEVRKWQLQKADAVEGTPEASGELTAEQAPLLFAASRFRLVLGPTG